MTHQVRPELVAALKSDFADQGYGYEYPEKTAIVTGWDGPSVT